MRFHDALRRAFQLLKVVAYIASNLIAINEVEELWLNACIKVLLDPGCLIAVNLDVLELGAGARKVVIVTFNLGTHRVPSGREVDHGECGPLFVQLFD